MLAVDNSGSMDFEVVFQSNDGALWWNANENSTSQRFTGLGQNDQPQSGVFNFNHDGSTGYPWFKYVYLFPNISRLYSYYTVPAVPAYAYARSPDYNEAYFNPAAIYKPWIKADRSHYPASKRTAAPVDPRNQSGQTLDLTAEQSGIFAVMRGMDINGVISTCPHTYEACSQNINYFPATFWLKNPSELPAGYGYTATPLTGTGPFGGQMYGYEIKPGNFDNSSDYDSAIQNFANWFTYYRRRNYAVAAGIGQAFINISNARLGAFTINNRPSSITMLDLSNSTDKSTFYQDVYGFGASPSGTPNRKAVNTMGQLLEQSGQGAPIQYACQKNFGILFTDGFSNGLPDGPSGIGNQDGDMGSPFADTQSNTMADIAAKYYKTDLRSDFPAGKVPVPNVCNQANPPKNEDCQKNLHMDLFAIPLSKSGTIFGVNQTETDDPYNNPPDWDNLNLNNNYSPTAIDDLWHATLNSRGNLIVPSSTTDIGNSFEKALNSIASRISSASSAATNSTSLSTGSVVYQARFFSGDWSGSLSAYSLDANGNPAGTPKWDAADQIPAPSARNIATYAGKQSVNFNWDNLTSNEQADLNGSDNKGQARLTYLRGDRSQESPSGAFRQRNSATVLGDIVNSDPLYVQDKNYGYANLPGTAGSSYYMYLNNQKSRQGVIYVGANDGMLHAFAASTGKELFAYVPQALYPKLSALTAPNYNTAHQYYVDGPSSASDAYLNNQWGTYVLGSLGAGGRGIFALNVTDPGTLGSSSVMWELSVDQNGNITPSNYANLGYTASNLDDLGYTIPGATIARMNNGEWVALIPNGYNSPSGTAALFIVDLETGKLVKEINTGYTDGTSKDNGLSGVAPVDIDNNGTIDYIYAGDLKGNLWKFDVSSTSPSNWGVAYQGGQTPQPLFVACSDSSSCDSTRRPITERPEVTRDSNGGLLVLFGTGRYYAVGDNQVTANSPTQSFYGIRDKTPNTNGGKTPDSRSNLLEQDFITPINSSIGDYTVRTSTANSISPDDEGWFIDLSLNGERSVADPVLRNGRIIFTTLVPNTDPCGFGGDSYQIELNAFNGARLDYSPFDLNNDGTFNYKDYATISVPDGSGGTKDVTVPVSGIRTSVGIVKTPTIISADGKEYMYLSGSNGKLEKIAGPAVGDSPRQSWLQLR